MYYDNLYTTHYAVPTPLSESVCPRIQCVIPGQYRIHSSIEDNKKLDVAFEMQSNISKSVPTGLGGESSFWDSCWTLQVGVECHVSTS